ncbi:diguanylate cyclase (GGDEF)-like protein [Halanaerobium saccharolyticum]|uniref:Diguanylate cyclase (GGDEF)-like protein n=1 Tax=Halanaerobium saccharolyticum TaxID=43595 RepID=A0A4R7Z8K6_9FIRM|nr:GGDEF domain-containing protein [Halanaerobium saccharolyticum]RAK11736.1 diguanylate cyclase (GGDEF)-like protein [Halanaerobium saccharolyticum]TDW07577.1 diguanylate cyclase (GGDEF)-like protein [Halanaerobium saccharolyticum]TDX64498.1 diguanylate cyclase (GGDEF)-like protein [Halanaerobium saccharolyticum]
MKPVKIGDICRENRGVTVPISVRTKNLVDIFNLKNIQSIVVLEAEKAAGLVMRDKLFYRLGSRFGYNLYMQKNVKAVMDSKPLIIDFDESVLKVSKIAMRRSQEKIYDSIIITKNNKYYGIMSIKDLLIEVSELKIKTARNANPLTGLPGNLTIESEIKEKIKIGEKFSVLYLDLDNFKAYNDSYGYHKGDEVINYTAEVLNNCAQKMMTDTFVGHIGGDDFVIITAAVDDEYLAELIIEKFDRGIINFFKNKDLLRGYIVCLDRQHQIVNTPLTSISIAIVSNSDGKLENHLEISDRAAELKKKAKEMSGSNFIKDRRMEKTNGEFELC